MSKHYYGTIQTGMEGRFAIQIPMDYPFWGSGVLLPPTIEVQLWGMYPVVFVLNFGEEELGKAFRTNQQNVSRYLKEGKRIQELVSAGSLTEKDIWGYSPTDTRRKHYATDSPQSSKSSERTPASQQASQKETP